jgi:site-specific recombinase XerD
MGHYIEVVFAPWESRNPKAIRSILLRHTIASHMQAGGTPLPVVSARLGHIDMQTSLRICGHMIHGQDDEAVHKLEEHQQRNRVASQAAKSVQ